MKSSWRKRIQNMTDTKQKEIWKTYPEYPFIEASNLGRVRTKDRTITDKNGNKRFVKGRILKQQCSNKGYMYVHFSVGGKQVVQSVHRIVITCFCKNSEHLPEVNHINNNPADNRLENLEYCTHEYNIAYREKYGKSAAKTFGKPVFAVNLKTGKVLRFESQCEAARQLGVSQGDIGKVIRGQQYATGGYWFTKDESEITEEKIQEIKANMLFLGGVIAINLETSEILYFESQHEAARKLGVYTSNITKVVKDKMYKTGGFWFCYADDNAVEKTRAKFGNKVAHEVEKLIGENYD